MFSQRIIDSLQRDFCIGFEIIDIVNDDNFSIGFSNQESHLISMSLFIRNDSRLKISIKMGNFAGDLVKVMSDASAERKQLFLESWKTISKQPCCQINLSINGEEISQDKFLSNGCNWKDFELNFMSFPFYDPDDGNRIEVVSKHCSDLWRMVLYLIPYTVEGEEEGTEYEKTITTHERNPINRQLCVQFKGYKCAVCGMDFESVYGKIGKHFIEVHHANPIADMGDNYKVDIINELYPLCSNCHSMIHRKKPPYTIDELKTIIASNKKL